MEAETYKLLRVLDPGTDHLLVLDHPLWGRQPWMASIVPEKYQCAHCEWHHNDVAYHPLSLMGNWRDRLCRPCVQEMIQETVCLS